MGNTKNNLSAKLEQSFASFFQAYPLNGVAVAYSGGLDSHVLLKLTSTLRHHYPNLSLRAIHIHHQIQAVSVQWVEHCRIQCAMLNIDLTIKTVTLERDTSLEAAARQARYAAFAQLLGENEALLVAHHQDDQAETLLLNLMRGAGLQGLAAIPVSRALGQGILLRPLLNRTRTELRCYAEEQQLHCINDPSNTDQHFGRNFLRHSVIPLLEQRWSAAKTLIARAAEHQREAVELTDLLLTPILQSINGSRPRTLSVVGLQQQPFVVQKALLRYWFKQLEFLPPDNTRLNTVLREVLSAKADTQPYVQWRGCEIRRYRDDLYAIPPLSVPPQPLQWTGEQACLFGDYTLKPSWVARWLATAQLQKLNFEVRVRQGGERFWYGKQLIDLKTYWQNKGIPPWERERIPLIWFNEQLIWVGEY